MDETRQSPEQILKQIEKEEQILNRGHLKIFFGYAAGVGKTYAMLKAAHLAKRRGIDVVAKPFSVEELLARLRVTQRRLNMVQKETAAEASVFTNGKLRLFYPEHLGRLLG